MQTIIAMKNLPAADRNGVHYLVEEVGMDGDLLPISRWKVEYILLPPLYTIYHTKGPATGIGAIGEINTIAYFVANKRLCAIEQHRHQHFVPVNACHHRTIVLIYILDNN